MAWSHCRSHRREEATRRENKRLRQVRVRGPRQHPRKPTKSRGRYRQRQRADTDGKQLLGDPGTEIQRPSYEQQGTRKEHAVLGTRESSVPKNPGVYTPPRRRLEPFVYGQKVLAGLQPQRPELPYILLPQERRNRNPWKPGEREEYRYGTKKTSGSRAASGVHFFFTDRGGLRSNKSHTLREEKEVGN